MDTKKLKELGSDKRFIKGIYNYCDRWCERCTHTSKCLNYSIVEEEFADPQSRDIHNEMFWKKLSGVFEGTMALLKERAEAEGIDLDAIDLNEQEEEDRLVDEAADGHEITRAARAYCDMAEDWFNRAEPLFGEGEKEGPDFRLHIKKTESGEKDDLEEALEVVRWYQHQIYVKMMRAVSGLIEEQDEDPAGSDEYARDSDGSAKVALIGIDRSVAAWGIIHDHFPSPDIQNMIGHLDRLRRRIERDFPHARTFICPGFDHVDLNS
jgi:hypothetical protein